MRSAILVLFSVLCSTSVFAQSIDTNLRSELAAIHTKWFEAYDSGDGVTLDQIETDNMTLVLNDGVIWTKTTARADASTKHEPQTKHQLSDVLVRRFGDTAILTGIVTAKSANESHHLATTVVFVRISGKWKIASAQWTPVEKD
jgi:ketosteroid isomerase-like protein